MTERLAELQANLSALQDRVAAACDAAGRRPEELTVVAVTKTFPVSDVRLLASLGVAEVGENKDQEAAAKVAQTADLPLRWHFVGRLQRNKCGSVARYAAVVHSVDRVELATALSQGARRSGRTVTALVQVSLDPEPVAGRGGVRPDGLLQLADVVAAAPGLSLGGVMGVAPREGDPGRAFATLAGAADRLRRSHPGAAVVSAGMSGDLEAAVRNGSTLLRVGTALLGRRTPAVG